MHMPLDFLVEEFSIECHLVGELNAFISQVTATANESARSR